MKRNKLLYASINENGDGFYLYLVPKEKRRYHDLYLLKIRGSLKKNKIDLYFLEREALELAVVLLKGVLNKKEMKNDVP